MILRAWLGDEQQGRKSRRRLMRRIRGLRFNLPPEVPGGGPAPAATPATQPAPSTPAPPAPSSTSGSGASGLPQPGATPAAATSPPTPAAAAAPAVQPPAAANFEQEFARRFGVDPSHARTLLTLGYQQWQNQGRQQPAAQPATPAAPEKKNPFGLPDFDYRLLDYVVKGPNGLEVIPGAPPDTLLRVQEFQDKFRHAQQNFFSDPAKFLAPLIEEAAAKKAEAIYNERFSGHQSQSAAQRIIQENESWLFEQQDGRPVTRFNPATGREDRVLSGWGQFYSQQLQAVAAAGVSDPVMQHQFALTATENAALRQRNQPAAAQAAGAAAAQGFLNGAAQQPVPPPPAVAPVAAPVNGQQVPFSLRDTLRQRFEANGITDQSIRNSMA